MRFTNYIFSKKRALDFPGYDGNLELLLKPVLFTFSESYVISLADFGMVFSEVAPLIEAMKEMKEQAARKVEEFIASTKDTTGVEVDTKGEDSQLVKLNVIVEAPIIEIPLTVRELSYSHPPLFLLSIPCDIVSFFYYYFFLWLLWLLLFYTAWKRSKVDYQSRSIDCQKRVLYQRKDPKEDQQGHQQHEDRPDELQH